MDILAFVYNCVFNFQKGREEETVRGACQNIHQNINLKSEFEFLRTPDFGLPTSDFYSTYSVYRAIINIESYLLAIISQSTNCQNAFT